MRNERLGLAATNLCDIRSGKLEYISAFYEVSVNPLTSNNLQRQRAVSPLKIKISSKNMCEKPTNTPIIHSVY
jgi:hypothetical protein